MLYEVITLVRAEEAHRLRAFAARRSPARGGEFQGLELGAGLVAGRVDARGLALARGRITAVV